MSRGAILGKMGFNCRWCDKHVISGRSNFQCPYCGLFQINDRKIFIMCVIPVKSGWIVKIDDTRNFYSSLDKVLEKIKNSIPKYKSSSKYKNF